MFPGTRYTVENIRPYCTSVIRLYLLFDKKYGLYGLCPIPQHIYEKLNLVKNESINRTRLFLAESNLVLF